MLIFLAKELHELIIKDIHADRGHHKLQKVEAFWHFFRIAFQNGLIHPEVHQQQKDFRSLVRILSLDRPICHAFFDNIADQRGAYPQIVPHHGQNKTCILLVLIHNAVYGPGCLTFQIGLEDLSLIHI